MRNKPLAVILAFWLCLLAGCQDSNSNADNDNTGGNGDNPSEQYTEMNDDMPAAGNPDGRCAVPDAALEEDTSLPDRIVGDGTAESCTSAAVVAAIAGGGIITFDCGPDPVTIVMEETAKVFNNKGPKIVIDGGGKVTLSGGAVWVRGGRLKVINCRFFNNVCADTGPDVGGAAIRVFSQFEHRPVYVVHSTFGGQDDLGNVCSNGGGISSIDVSWTVINSLFTHNKAIGNGGNPERTGTPGGGSGGAIYNDGNTMRLSLCGTVLQNNEVNTHGSAIFFVSNNHDGTIQIRESTISGNTNHSGHPWEIEPGISGHSDTEMIVDEVSVIQE